MNLFQSHMLNGTVILTFQPLAPAFESVGYQSEVAGFLSVDFFLSSRIPGFKCQVTANR